MQDKGDHAGQQELPPGVPHSFNLIITGSTNRLQMSFVQFSHKCLEAEGLGNFTTNAIPFINSALVIA